MKIVFQDFAQASLGPFSVFVPFATAIMLLGSVNAEIFVSSRIIYEAARRGDLPPFAAAVHKETNSYRAALLLQVFSLSIFKIFFYLDDCQCDHELHQCRDPHQLRLFRYVGPEVDHNGRSDVHQKEEYRDG